MSGKIKAENPRKLIDVGGRRPAGWVYVASHPLATGHTKIGYSMWHPTEACFRYPDGIKRIHRLEFSLRAFGLGCLRKWSSEYDENAERIENEIHRHLRAVRRDDVGTAREIFAISHGEAVSLVRKLIPGSGCGEEC